MEPETPLVELRPGSVEPAGKPKLRRKTRPQKGDLRYGRTAVSNGTQLLPGLKGTNVWVRRCKDIIADHLSDLGGADNTSSAERSLIGVPAR